MGHWQVKGLASDVWNVFIHLLANPFEECFPKSDYEEAEQAVDVVVIGKFISFFALQLEYLLCKFRVLSMFYLPETHQEVRLRAHPCDRIAYQPDKSFKVLDIETQTESVLEVAVNRQLVRRVESQLWLL